MADSSPSGCSPSAGSSTSSKPQSAADRLMAIPHIVTAIIEYARQDRTTLARLMRTSKDFYMEVGPVLYHTVAIWEETIDSFFRGSFTPCYCEECVNDLKEKWGIDHANKCFTERGKLTNKPHSYGKYNNPIPSPQPATPKKKSATINTPDASPSKSSAVSTPGPATPESGKKPDAKTPNDNKAEEAQKSKNAKKNKKKKEAKKAKKANSKKAADGFGSDDEVANVLLPISKKDLLRCVRVLTLGCHHESACEIHSARVEEFMQGVEVLRVVESPCAPHRTFHICENIPGGSCPIIDALNPRKIVVRNISGLPVPFPPTWKANTKTKEMVFVLSTQLMAYTGSKGECPSDALLKSLLGQFNEVDRIRVVFWPEWDDSLTHHPLARKLDEAYGARVYEKLKDKPLPVDYIAAVMHALTMTRRLDPLNFRRPSVDFYGFSTTSLSTYGSSNLVAEHKKQHGEDAKYDLHSLAKRKAMLKMIGMATNGVGGGYVLGSCDVVNWFTIGNYKRKKFAAEISEWD